MRSRIRCQEEKMERARTLVLPVNIALLVVGLVDLLTTIHWVSTGRAIEFNPVMAAALNAGWGVFIAVKLSTLGAFVAVTEWYRRHRSATFAATVGNITLFSYMAIYGVSFLCVNYDYLIG